eukprot:6205883-Lingulodinium_polyedra.AAC.1
MHWLPPNQSCSGGGKDNHFLVCGKLLMSTLGSRRVDLTICGVTLVVAPPVGKSPGAGSISG